MTLYKIDKPEKPEVATTVQTGCYKLLPYRCHHETKLRLQPRTPTEAAVRVSKVTSPRRKRCRGHHHHPIRHSPILGFHSETTRHEILRCIKLQDDTSKEESNIHRRHCWIFIRSRASQQPSRHPRPPLRHRAQRGREYTTQTGRPAPPHVGTRRKPHEPERPASPRAGTGRDLAGSD